MRNVNGEKRARNEGVSSNTEVEIADVARTSPAVASIELAAPGPRSIIARD